MGVRERVRAFVRFHSVCVCARARVRACACVGVRMHVHVRRTHVGMYGARMWACSPLFVPVSVHAPESPVKMKAAMTTVRRGAALGTVAVGVGMIVLDVLPLARLPRVSVTACKAPPVLVIDPTLSPRRVGIIVHSTRVRAIRIAPGLEGKGPPVLVSGLVVVGLPSRVVVLSVGRRPDSAVVPVRAVLAIPGAVQAHLVPAGLSARTGDVSRPCQGGTQRVQDLGDGIVIFLALVAFHVALRSIHDAGGIAHVHSSL